VSADDRIDVLVAGAGVVGLAVARALALAGHEVVICEAEGSIGSGVSARNSEVIHAGLYYPPGSWKARLCVEGKQRLYAYCAERGVAVKALGKLVVATREQDVPGLHAIAERGRANGVHDLQLLGRAGARALEPALECAAALWSPSSGIVDSHGLMTALLGDAENAGALLALKSRVLGARRVGDAWCVRVESDGETSELHTRWLVNAAALDAQALAHGVEGFPAAAIPRRHVARGHYFALSGSRAPFTHLIYPQPVDGGLGVHLTLDLAGQARFGPDVQWFESEARGAALDYAVDPARAAAFEAEIRRWWPGLPAGALVPAYTGIRPKITGPGETAADFRLDGPAVHGVPGVVMLFGIESPGLTAALAIGEHVTRILAAQSSQSSG
jgi:L-2-hydroxyglutarate oxidase LhgO